MLRYPYTFSSNILRRFCSFPYLTVKETLLQKPIDQKILVQGHVQAVRRHKNVFFVDLTDGTCLDRLQIVLPAENNDMVPQYGSSIKVEGSIIKSSHKGQELELIADSWKIHGSCSDDYPFVNRQKFSNEYIRQYPHLRPRTRKISSISRVKAQAKKAARTYLEEQGICEVDATILTQNDCEGAGEVFTVEAKQKPEDALLDKRENANSKVISNPNNEGLEGNSEGDSQYFFGDPVFLTVSEQFHLEAMAGGLTRVYTIGPTFRAERSRTRQHLSEFQMIEAEIAFIEKVDDLLKIVENLIKKVVEHIMENCAQEVQFISQDLKNHESYIKNLLLKPFIRMSYEDSINILQKNNGSMKNPIKFGEDLSAQHKEFLLRYCDNIPVFVSMFPSTMKPFYMKSDESNRAMCFDLFASYGGEICGGSLRENNYEKLKTKYPFDDNSSLLWYLDLRKYGSVPSGGFGIGFERLMQSILGLSNIRDVRAFPRRKNDCKC